MALATSSMAEGRCSAAGTADPPHPAPPHLLLLGLRTGNAACTACPSSTYQPTEAANSVSLCLPCNSNTMSEAGSSACRECPTGAEDVNNLACIKPDGTAAGSALSFPVQVKHGLPFARGQS